jgi:hypothetical protein
MTNLNLSSQDVQSSKPVTTDTIKRIFNQLIREYHKVKKDKRFSHALYSGTPEFNTIRRFSRDIAEMEYDDYITEQYLRYRNFHVRSERFGMGYGDTRRKEINSVLVPAWRKWNLTRQKWGGSSQEKHKSLLDD